MIQKRGQASLEYMMIIGFSTLLLIPLLILFANEQSEITIKVDSNQAQIIERKLCDAAESVFYLGPPSKTRLKVYMPNNIEDIQYQNQTLSFFLKAEGDLVEIPRTCLVSLTENLSTTPGFHYIALQAQGDTVLVYNE